MKLMTLVLCAMWALVPGFPAEELEKRQEPTKAVDILYVFSVLQTALPATLVQLALTNQAVVSSIIASQFKAGSTPGWFQSLPTEVKTFLIPLATDIPGAFNSALGRITTTSESASTLTTTRTTASLSSTSRISASTVTVITDTPVPAQSFDEAAATSTGGAALPTAVAGAVFVGAIGALGILAL